MNMKIALLLIGLVVGGLVGYVTRPEAAELRIGPVEIEVRGNDAASSDDPVTGGQMRYIAICAAIGALAGLGLGFVLDRR
jgi:hypothetical protein